jgi:hypothetical protein
MAGWTYHTNLSLGADRSKPEVQYLVYTRIVPSEREPLRKFLCNYFYKRPCRPRNDKPSDESYA